MESQIRNTPTRPGPRLAIFDTFKTRRSQLSTKARRQRSILCMLAQGAEPGERTRTAISKKIAAPAGSKWQTAYPGVFKDIEEALLPSGVIREEGRLPVKRGPRALQSRGSPYYGLTDRGTVVALAIREMPGREEMLGAFLDGGVRGGEALRVLAGASPEFVYAMIRRHVEEWCRGRAELLPFDPGRLLDDGSLAPCRALLESFAVMSREQREVVAEFLRSG